MNKKVSLFLVLISLLLLVAGFFIEYAWPAGYILLFIAGCDYFFKLVTGGAIDLEQEKTTDTAQLELFNNVAYMVLNDTGIEYENPVFKNVFELNVSGNREKLMDAIHFNSDKQRIQFNGREFWVRSYPYGLDHLKKILFFFDDEDDTNLPDITISNIAIGLIFVDNYDDVMDTVEDTKKPFVQALIDRKINAFAQQVDGVVRKFEDDKHFIVFDSRKLEEVKAGPFKILDEVREIDFGNKLPFTLSIGIGINGATIRQAMEYARAAIDLGLGRGGDQALIKNGEKYEFFGGNGKETEASTSVRARVKAYALTEIIMESDAVLIMGHRNADLDCLGAGIGVFRIATALGKKCNIILNNPTSAIKGMYDRLMELEQYQKGAFVTSEEALRIVRPGIVLIIVDCHRPSIMECPQILDLVHKVVLVDHHRKGIEFVANPVLAYHEPYASSTCELIIEMVRQLNQKIIFNPVEADALLAGITVDTKNFVIKTGTKTFEAAAFLKRNGADTVRVRMVMQNDMESYKAKSIAVNNAKTIRDNIAIAFCPTQIENPQLVNAQIADELLNITGIEASFSIYFDHAVESVQISARSLGNINVQVIMEKLGGGGHQTAAGAQVQSEDVDEVIEQLNKSISEYMANS